MDKETNPQNQYVVSYNENDFYCNSIGKSIFKKILDTENIPSIQSYCKTNQPFTISTNVCSDINNNYANKDQDEGYKKCNVLNEICKNQKNYDKLKEIQTTHSVSTSRFQDMNSFYNTEVLKSFNLAIGIAFISFVIFREI